MYIYLDHNIYISALNDSTLKSFLTSVDDQKAIFLYSPAHIEEIFKVLANDKSQHQVKMLDLLDLIEKVTKRRELLPTKSKIVIKSESPQKCLERVADYDTREIFLLCSLIISLILGISQISQQLQLFKSKVISI